jgi:arginine repressor
MWAEYNALNDRDDYRASQRTFSQRLRQLGFVPVKKSAGMHLRLSVEALQRIQEQHREVADDNVKETDHDGVADS